MVYPHFLVPLGGVDAFSATTAEYVYLNGQPLAKIEGTNTYYYHNDHLATPQKMTDSTGTVVWSADYKPFGEATITVSTITNNLRFPGQYFDAETGLNYNYFRDYNPVIGRYVEADPLGLKGGFNPYIYANANSLINVDSYGLEPGGGANAAITNPPGLPGTWIVPYTPPRPTNPQYCKGEWRQLGWDRVFNFECKCYWQCISCDRPKFWFWVPESGSSTFKNIFTYGNIQNVGAGAGAKRGNDCLCDKPGPDENCKKCEK